MSSIVRSAEWLARLHAADPIKCAHKLCCLNTVVPFALATSVCVVSKSCVGFAVITDRMMLSLLLRARLLLLFCAQRVHRFHNLRDRVGTCARARILLQPDDAGQDDDLGDVQLQLY